MKTYERNLQQINGYHDENISGHDWTADDLPHTAEDYQHTETILEEELQDDDMSIDSELLDRSEGLVEERYDSE